MATLRIGSMDAGHWKLSKNTSNSLGGVTKFNIYDYSQSAILVGCQNDINVAMEKTKGVLQIKVKA